MSGITFLSDNLIDDSTLSITTGAENAQFPLDNLKNDFTTKKFRSVGNAVVFVADFLQIRSVDYIAVAGDATESLGLTAMSVKFSITTDFSSSTSHTVDLSGQYNLGLKDLGTAESARYCEITLTGTGGYSEIGKLFIGEKVNLPQNSLSISSFKLSRTDNSNISKNKFGQKFIDIRNQTKTIKGTIQYLTKSEVDIVDGLFIEHAKNKPIWLIIDPSSSAMVDGKFKLSNYSYFSNDPSISASGGQTYNVSLSMELVV